MIKKLFLLILLLLITLSGLVVSCSRTTTPPVTYSVPQLKYLLIDHFGGVFYCDPDLYPIARPGVEEQNAIEQFPAIYADQAEFTAIIQHLNLPNQSDYTLEQKVAIYREYKKLTLSIILLGTGPYSFDMRVGENNGYRYQGTITSSGNIKVTSKENSFNTCPICLPAGTLIGTPDGRVAVENITPGMTVWTVDLSGNRVIALVLKTSKTPVMPFLMVEITLADGRTITASPGHPSAAGIALGSYKTGETLDGSIIAALNNVLYNGSATYDILPSGETGQYWANGILLASTLY